MSAAQSERRGGREHRLSLGDCLVLAVAQRLGSPVVTADRHWSWLAARGRLEVTVHQI